MKNNQFPTGWDEARVQHVLELYENQADDEAIAEDEAAFENSNQIFMEIPKDLAPIIRAMIAMYHPGQLVSA